MENQDDQMDFFKVLIGEDAVENILNVVEECTADFKVFFEKEGYSRESLCSALNMYLEMVMAHMATSSLVEDEEERRALDAKILVDFFIGVATISVAYDEQLDNN